MRSARILSAALLCAVLAGGTALASWYDDYDAGIAAARKGQWQVVVQKMTAAIAGNGKEGDRTRTYGAIFISYHPYYYRGVAYLNLGKYEQAIKDFETTSGPGEENLGTLDENMRRAKTKLAEANSAPETPTTRTTTPTPPIPVPQTPTGPSIDAGLRARARAALDQAKGRIQAAGQRKASGSPSYAQALQQYTDANTRWAAAKSNDDLNAVLAAADNITMLADSAQAPGVPPVPSLPVPSTTRSTAASTVVLADTSRRVRHALESYFSGDFDIASRDFEALTRELPDNPWIWAFLGASQYSQYAFEADETYKASALSAFRKAKKARAFRNGLPEKYFSKKIRKAFSETAG